jgi:hypothetical protein
MTEGEEGKLEEAERGDRALRSIALFVEETGILSLPHDAQRALSLPIWSVSHNQFGGATKQRPIPCETATVQPSQILEILVRNSPIRSGKPLVPRTPPFSQRRENKCPIKKRLTRRLAATVGSSFCSFAAPESLLAENIDENSHK